MKTYVGVRAVTRLFVYMFPDALRPSSLLPFRLDLWKHSPDGFECGYAGSGPAQLALAILADYLGDDELAVDLHQPFKRDVIARLPRDGWHLHAADIDAWLEQFRYAPANGASEDKGSPGLFDN